MGAHVSDRKVAAVKQASYGLHSSKFPSRSKSAGQSNPSFWADTCGDGTSSTSTSASNTESMASTKSTSTPRSTASSTGPSWADITDDDAASLSTSASEDLRKPPLKEVKSR